MKKILIWLAISSLHLAAFAQNQNQPFRSQIISHEINKVNGSMNIDLRIYADADLKLNHEIYLRSTQELQLKDHNQEKPYGKIEEFLKAGDSTTISLSILYSKKKLPYNYQNIRLSIKGMEPGIASAEAWAFIYFTPYKSIEVWNPTDFGNLKRDWNTIQPEEELATRIYIHRKNIPASDLSDFDFSDPNVAKSYITIAGLDYAIPMHFIEKEGNIENLPARDKSNTTKTASYFSLEQ